jgi:hypothetical protein
VCLVHGLKLRIEIADGPDQQASAPQIRQVNSPGPSLVVPVRSYAAPHEHVNAIT